MGNWSNKTGTILADTKGKPLKKKVLFVCMGNICRSPAGECIFRSYLTDMGIEDDFLIDSAGTTAYHIGESPDPRMRRAGSERGVEIVGRGRQFETDDFDRFDLIVAMDRENLRDILRLDPRSRHRDKVHLLCQFIPDSPSQDVPDPYYGGSGGFDHVMDLIEEACPGILEKLQNGCEAQR